MTFSKHLFLFTISIIFSLSHLLAQDTIYFENPSFEDITGHSRTPKGWTNCGYINESPPDVLPHNTFQVFKKAFDGQTYLGMVVRDNGTYESVGNQLTASLKKGGCYQFEITLARSLSYLSVSRKLNEPANYITPAKLRIWGGSSLCEKTELLAVSDMVESKDWITHTFHIQTQSDDINFILLEAYFEKSNLHAYNGNLLVDAASAFIPIQNCDNTSTIDHD